MLNKLNEKEKRKAKEKRQSSSPQRRLLLVGIVVLLLMGIGLLSLMTFFNQQAVAKVNLTRTAISEVNSTVAAQGTLRSGTQEAYLQETGTAIAAINSTMIAQATASADAHATNMSHSIRGVTRTAIADINATVSAYATQTALAHHIFTTQTAIAREINMILTPATPTAQPCFFVWHVPSREQDTETLPALLDAAGIVYSEAFTEIFWGEDQICGDEVREALVMRTEYHVTVAADNGMMNAPVQKGDTIADILAVLTAITPDSPAEIHIHFENGDTQDIWAWRFENAISAYQYGLRGMELFESAP